MRAPRPHRSAALAHEGATLVEEVVDHADPEPVDSVTERPEQARWRPVEGGGVGRVVAGDHLEGERSVGDAGGERADLVEGAGKGDQAVAGDEAVGGLDPDDAAERGRLADGTSGVRAEPGRDEAGGDGGGRPAGRASRHPPEIPRVVRRPEGGVLGRGSHRELVEVRLSDEDGARLGEAGHHRGVIRRPPPLEDPRGAGRRDPLRAEVVLHDDRHPGEGPGVPTGGQGVVDGAGGTPGLVGHDEVEAVERVLICRRRGRAPPRRPRRPSPRRLRTAAATAAAPESMRPPAPPRAGRSSRLLPEDRRHLEAVALDSRRSREDDVAVEARPGSSARSTFESGSGCAVGGTSVVSSRRTLSTWSSRADSSTASVATSSSLRARRARRATWRTSSSEMRSIYRLTTFEAKATARSSISCWS